MKKLFLVSALALFGLSNAQEYKSVAGDISVDFGVAGGLGNTTVNLPDQGFGTGAMLRGRYFKTDKIAYRAAINLQNASNTTHTATTKDEVDNFGFALALGMEKHFTGTERLSPYVGADVVLGYFSNSTKSTDTTPAATGTSEIKGPNDFRFGVRGVFGADYYIAKRLYLGVEAGLGLMFVSGGDTTIKTPGIPDVVQKGGSSFNIGPDVVTGIRIGYLF